MGPARFLRLEDVVFTPSASAAIAILLVCGVATAGHRLGRRWYAREGHALAVAIGFVLASAGLSVGAHALVLAHLSRIAVLRPIGWAIAALGLAGALRHAPAVAAAA